MRRRAATWLAPALLYAAFTLWYTNLGGPLESEEIEAFVATLEAAGENPEQVASLRRFMESDSGRQFLMVNLIDAAVQPPDVPGAEPGETTEQLMGRFFEGLIPGFLGRACHPILFGTAVHPALDVFGVEGAAEWESFALVRYRSRRDMMELVGTLLARHEFKLAALEKQIAFAIEPRLYLSDPRLLLALVGLAGTALVDGIRARRSR
jgi:hypothetical protein